MKNFFITALKGLCTFCEFVMNLLALLMLFGIGMGMLYCVIEIPSMLTTPHVEDPSEANRWVYGCINIKTRNTDAVTYNEAKEDCLKEGPPQWYLDDQRW